MTVMGQIVILFLCHLIFPATRFAEHSSPKEVVQNWLKIYPSDMNKAVELTTGALRDGLSKQDWGEAQRPMLKSLQMKYINGKVVFEQIKGDQAVVLAPAYISTIMGDQQHQELYRLRKTEDGHWLIDRGEENAENFVGRQMC